MLPWEIVDRARAPDGSELVLARRGEEWVVRVAGRVLMSSRMHGSEETLAKLALGAVKRPKTILIGGLGLGYTLRAALDRLPRDARAVVAELVPAVGAWNREKLGHLAGRPLDDPRVRLQHGDVLGRIRESKSAYDAILLDVDNGAAPIAHAANVRLYGDEGIYACRDALRPGGVLAVWSAGPDERYVERLERAGFEAEARKVPARGGEGVGTRHVIFLAVRPAKEARAAIRAAGARAAAGRGAPAQRAKGGGAGGRPRDGRGGR